jgi:type II secretory pathway pseudopilin PulG
LIELLVVLFLVGLLTAVVLPGMERMARSAQHKAERDTIIGRLEELGYEAFLTGKAIALTSSPSGASAVSANYPIKVPEGWRLSVASPVVYGFNGICSGGQVVLLAPDQTQENLVLRPPLCKVEARVAN